MHHHRHFVYNVYWATLRLTLQSAIAQHVSIMATRPCNNMNQRQEPLKYFRRADSLSRRFVLFCLHPLTLVGWVKETTCVNSVHISIAFFFFSLPSLFFYQGRAQPYGLGQTPLPFRQCQEKDIFLAESNFLQSCQMQIKGALQCGNGLGLSKQLQICVFNGQAQKLGWPECYSSTVNKL